MHHLHYVKYKARGPISYAHIMYGRTLMLLGVINGGLGLALAHAPQPLVVAYSVVAAIIFVLYVVVKLVNKLRSRRARGGPLSGRKEAYSLQNSPRDGQNPQWHVEPLPGQVYEGR